MYVVLCVAPSLWFLILLLTVSISSLSSFVGFVDVLGGFEISKKISGK